MCDKSILTILKQIKSIESQTIDSLISNGFDSNQTINALDFDSDLPQMTDISNQQKLILTQVLTQIRQKANHLNEDQLSDWPTKQLVGNEIQTNCLDINQQLIYGPIHENLILLKNRFSETEDLIESKISQESNGDVSESDLRQLNKSVEQYRQELDGFNALIKSIEENTLKSKSNRLVVHQNNLIRMKNLMTDPDIDSHEVEDHKEVDEPSNVEISSKKGSKMVNNSRKVNPKRITIKCEYDMCLKSFKTSSRFIRHLESFHMKNDSSNQTIGSSVETSKLLKIGRKSKSFQFKCPFDSCKMSFQRKIHFKQHLDVVHMNQKSNSFQTQLKAKINSRNVRPIVGLNFDCNQKIKCNFKDCDQKFLNIQQLNQHLKNSHKLAKNDWIECNFCHKLFANRSGLQRHNNLHLGIKQFNCSHKLCKCRFATNYELNRHLKIHQK